MIFWKNRRAQIAIYVIIALVLVGGTITFFAFRDRLFAPTVPPELKPVFDYYLSCLDSETKAAISLSGSQGGRIYPGEYIPGSEYAPFSSQLNFLGFPVPYWYYISGNGLIKEDVPTKSEMEKEISQYISENLNDKCNFKEFYDRGFEIGFNKVTATTSISDTQVDVSVDAALTVSKRDGVSSTKTTHSVTVLSKFGKLYKTALEIYNKEKKESFLENYSVDILRLYAPVDGVELSCAGKIWRTRDVVNDLKDAIQANVAAIRFKGNYYSLKTKDENYFVINLPVEESVNLLYSKNWPTKVEIYGADDELMVAEPTAAEQGASALGFCYAPYHFVYDISYPVLFQVYAGTEIFQFPVVVVVDKNLPREGRYTEIGYDTSAPDVCQFKTQDIAVNVYDNNLNQIDANLSFECFDQTCKLGETREGMFEGKSPSCVNGYIVADAGGYAKKKELASTNEQSSFDIILDKEYEVNILLKVDGEELGDRNALVVFSSQKSASALLPDIPKIKLSEGSYNVSVYTYSNSTLTIPSSTKRQCAEVSKGGLSAFFGQTEEKCFNIDIPETKVEQALVGGGKSEVYLLTSDLEKGYLEINVNSLPTPNSLEQMQTNYILFNEMGVEVVYE